MLFSQKPKIRPQRMRGLTLMETTLATIIVGLAVLSIVKLAAATTSQTSYSQKLTTAFMLGNNIREMMASLPFNDPLVGNHINVPALTNPANNNASTLASYNDIQDFDNFIASPPIDANRQRLAPLNNWQQTISVQMLGDASGLHINNPNNTSGATNPAIVERVRVTVSYSPTGVAPWTQVVTLSWLKTKY